MEKKKFNFKKFGLVLCVCFITLFAFIPFAKLNNIPFVSADSVSNYYEYSSSTLYIPLKRGSDLDANNAQLDLLNWNIKINSSFSGLTVDLSSSTGYCFTGTSTWGSQVFNFKNVYSYYTDYAQTNQLISINYGTSIEQYLYCSYDNIHINYLVSFSCSSNFNCNIKSVELGFENNNSKYQNYVRYTDFNGGTFVVKFYTANIIGTNSLLSYRIYYLTPDFTDNDIYNSGYNDGYNNGINDGNSSGYQDGYSAGSTAGYENGYNAGINDSNQYSFYNLFGAVLDAPVRVFTDLFNFNLLGVNLFGLITGLLTLGFVILIIKLLIGGK